MSSTVVCRPSCARWHAHPHSAAGRADAGRGHPDAGAKMAALGEVQQQVLGKDGLASYLGVIGLPFTEEEQNAMNQELQEFRESLEV